MNHAWHLRDDFTYLPVESFAGLSVDCSCVELHFSVLLESLKESHGMFVARLFQEVNKHYLEFRSATVFGVSNVYLVYELSIQSVIECIAHINFVVVGGNTWNADREHCNWYTVGTIIYSGIFLSILFRIHKIHRITGLFLDSFR